jgi:hypothetical protein
MPWQRMVVDVALEIDPVSGRLAYDEVGLTVPRQSGKSTLILAKTVHRCSATAFFGERQRVTYTAQTRIKAREKWEEDYVADLEAARGFRGRFRVNRPPGNEHIRFQNGSRFGIESSTEKAGHGGTLDEAFIDEAFAQVDHRLEQAFGPAMITRANKQLWWVSTAGWLDGSPYLQDKVAQGRKAVAQGRTRGLAYFEYSAPDDADPGDEATWLGCMPALGFTITLEAIRSEYVKALDAGRLDDFKRAYLNIWVPKPVEVAAIEPAAVDITRWRELTDMDASHAPAVLQSMAIEVDRDRVNASIGAAGVRDDGRRHLELVERAPGVKWIVPFAKAIEAKNGPVQFVVDGGGPAADLVPDLEAEGLTVLVAGLGDVAAAAAGLVDDVREGDAVHGPDEVLDTAVRCSRKRTFRDGGFAFGRVKSTDDVTPLVAVSLASWGLDHAPGVSIFGGGDLDLCDRCGERPHDDPDGVHDFLCETCRDDEEVQR